MQIESVEVIGDGRRVVADVVDHGVVAVAALWLRDACQCATCRRPTTNERRLDPTTVDPQVAVLGAAVDDGLLTAEMSDGHRVSVSSATVSLASQAAEVSPSSRPVADVVAAEAFERHAAADLDTGLLEVLDALDRDGALVVTGVDASDDGLRQVAARIGPIHATNYGVTWEIDAVLDPVSEVESSRALLVHTDLPYRTDPPGVQLLLACRVETAGGASTLVDGHAAATRFAADDPDGFDLLAAVSVEYPYVRDDVEIIGSAPLIEVESGVVRRIRRAPDLMGSPAVGADRAEAFYAALGRWWRTLDDADAVRQVALSPGELLMFDNHRMLHGRTAFELGASGRRTLVGCYLHADDVASRRAVLRRTG